MIRDVCKAPTLRLNKHSITRIMSIEMETVIGSLTKSEHIMYASRKVQA